MPNQTKPLSGKHLIVVGGGLAGCSVAHFAQGFFDQVTLIDDFSSSRRNAFLANAGSLHVGYGTTGHAHSAMIKSNSPILDTIKMSMKHPDAFSLLFSPKISSGFRALSTLWGLYDKQVASHSASIFYYLYKRSSEIIEKIIAQEKVPTKKGRIALCRTEEYFTYIQKQLKIANENFVIHGETLSDLKSIKKLLPSVSDDVVGGIYYPEDISFHPPAFSDAWLKKLSKRVKLINGKVTDVVVKDRQVESIKMIENGENQDLPVKQVVFCTGCFNHPIMNPYTLPGGGISIDVQLQKNARVGKTHLYTPEKLVYIYPYAKDKMRLCSGLYMNKASLSQARVGKVYRYLKDTFHEYYDHRITIENIIDTYIGARPISTDAMPIAGKLPYLENGYIVNGLGSYGYPAAALVEAILFPKSNSPTPPPSLSKRVDPGRFSSLWTSLAKKLI